MPEMEISFPASNNQFFNDYGQGFRIRHRRLLVNTLDKMADDMHDAAVAFAPMDTGETRASIAKDRAEETGNVGRFRAYVRLPREPKHNIWVHEGTGIYGERHTPIRSPKGNIMQFFHVGQWWSLKTVKGQTPQPFMREAYIAVADSKVPARVRTLAYKLRTQAAVPN
jgi:hypothetical protein